MTAPLVFLAVAARHPELVPLEVAWIAADLSAGESWRVRPEPEWEAPSEDAALPPPGLEPETLERQGVPARRIAARLAEDLAGCTVAGAAPAATEALLDRLYAATPLGRPFVLRDADGLRRAAYDDPDEAESLRARAAAGLRPGRAPDAAAGLALAHALAGGLGTAAALGDRARRLLAAIG